MSAAVTASNAATAANGVSSAASSSAVAAGSNASKPAVQPSEVGWLFVTQYYTFLNQNPGRLHCFFTKKSTMVHGTEQEESSPCFGQQQIHDKITSLNFQDAKVFVSNVDTQSSASGGILVQVLGELSNNGGAWRKFAQTFFLAEQPNGYYVLNDIFRYLKDDDEIEAEAEAEAVDEAIQDEIDEADKKGVEVPHTIEINNIGNSNARPNLLPPSSSSSKAIESTETATADDAAAADAQDDSAQITEVPAADEAVTTSTEAVPTKTDAVEEAPAAATEGGAAKDAAAAAKTETAPEAAASAPAAAAPAPAQPTGPPKPKTWATLAASDATRWGSNVSTEAKGVSSSRAAAASAAPAKPASTPKSAAAPAGAAATGAGAGASSSPSVYIKNVVADQVNESALRQALEAFGTVKDVQIIAARSCAFAEFTSVDGARKAAAKGSVAVGKNGWSVTIEERRKNVAGGAGGRAPAGGAGRGGAAGGNGRTGGAPRGGAAAGGRANGGRGGAARGGAN
ncbi:RNA recognition motif domain protein [Kalmanozyma brasiliensis GHG001]|uniref:Ras-GTPase-activating protein binding protein 2 n=1 Tax=Kalmanozyma brasiliensis (strain GHG001) TaxID=1365824 RepID=V5GJ91_KALBG|nr:RNA recognition motif domain protein [Kalmanozyma brasiliensis GHG001]EST06022.1 RNA recognition motif domain protein [Kalmanozyma brasiliensis GHG001]